MKYAFNIVIIIIGIYKKRFSWDYGNIYGINSDL